MTIWRRNGWSHTWNYFKNTCTNRSRPEIFGWWKNIRNFSRNFSIHSEIFVKVVRLGFPSVKFLKNYIPKAEKSRISAIRIEIRKSERKIPKFRKSRGPGLIFFRDLKLSFQGFFGIFSAIAILIPEIWDFYHERLVPIISHLWFRSINMVKQLI